MKNKKNAWWLLYLFPMAVTIYVTKQLRQKRPWAIGALCCTTLLLQLGEFMLRREP